jgi:tellurite methyltransferase
MEIHAWERRYRSKERPDEDYKNGPAHLLVETAEKIHPGRALDLACGTGRNALWLSQQGWRVTAVDGAPSAIQALLVRAAERHLKIDTSVADLEKHQFKIVPVVWDLIVISYYLQRDLFAPAKRGVVPGGILLAIVHTTESGEKPASHRLQPGKLKNYFRGWQILHYYEGSPLDAAHKRRVAEIVARKPRTNPKAGEESLKWSGNPQLLHTRLEGSTLHTQHRRGTFGSAENPLGLLKSS